MKMLNDFASLLVSVQQKSYKKNALDELDTHQKFGLKVYSHRVTRIKLAFNLKLTFTFIKRMKFIETNQNAGITGF